MPDKSSLPGVADPPAPAIDPYFPASAPAPPADRPGVTVGLGAGPPVPYEADEAVAIVWHGREVRVDARDLRPGDALLVAGGAVRRVVSVRTGGAK